MSPSTLASRAPMAGRRPAPDTFPRWVLWCAAGLIAFSLIGVGLVRITGNGPDQLRAAALRQQAQATPDGSASRVLRFEDRPDGAIAVIDARNGRLVTEFRGEQGFVRGSLRALTRERRAREMGPDIPFELMAHPDGRLTLLDMATGQRVDLASFGPTNAASFAALLEPASPASARPAPVGPR